jgi:hypothetical protein
VHAVIKVTADSCAKYARRVRFKIKHLTSQAAFPEQAAVMELRCFYAVANDQLMAGKRFGYLFAIS